MSLSMRNIVKSFDTVRVLRGVNFELSDGEIRALIGENGAGKTTLMNILGGVLKADEGDILLDGKPVAFEKPRDSLDAGIAFIHQELNLVNDLNVYENLFLGREIKKRGFVDGRAMAQKAREVLGRLDIELDPLTALRDLDASYKQIVEIARALMMNARVIIMDEPTTSLTELEIQRVFRMMKSVAKQGVSVVFISHKLKEVLEVCDSFTVLRDGALVKSGAVADASELSLAHLMVGHDVRTGRVARSFRPGAEALRVENFTRAREFYDISFSVREKEILGFTGLLGDGRSELFQAVFGATRADAGEIFIRGEKRHIATTSAAYKAGLGYVPRNRKENGIVKDLSILENGSLVTLKELERFLLIDEKKRLRDMEKNVRDLSIKLDKLTDPITSLSGGNQQKVVLAKWLSASPRVMIFDNPTQGVDVGAKEEIYDIILRLAEKGVAVIVLSSEAQEILRVCDRALVMYHGRIAGELAGEKLSENNIMILATGARLPEEAEAASEVLEGSVTE